VKLRSIRLTNFKNYDQASFDFSKRFNAFTAMNGSGKTNLLDAIYYLCIGKSYFQNVEMNNVRHGADFFRLEGLFSSQQNENIAISYSRRTKKKIERNGLAYEQLVEHVGRFPITFIAPDDNMLLLGPSQLRRRYMDSSLSQSNTDYMRTLLTYNKLLSQRNSVLKQDVLDETLLAAYSEQMMPLASKIHDIRSDFASQIRPVLLRLYQRLSDDREAVDCVYKSQLTNESMADLFSSSRAKDIVLRRTTCGIHQDDLTFVMNGRPIKTFGSQGQQKSFLLALKLSQLHYFNENKAVKPILLLDDVFDKLDEGRIHRLLTYLIEADIDQIFISDTDEQRLTMAVESVNADYEIFTLAQSLERSNEEE